MSDHSVRVYKINAIKPHTNADKLEIIQIEGFQAVVGRGQFEKGDLAYYIPPDSIVPDAPAYSFVWGDATFEGGTPEKKRRITVRKFRGEWSEGLLMPVPQRQLNTGHLWGCPRNPAYGGGGCSRDGCSQCNAPYEFVKNGKLVSIKEGDDVAELFHIRHYEPPEPGEPQLPTGGNGKKGLPRSFRGWYNLIKSWLSGERREARGPEGVPTYDVENIKKFMHAFEPGEMVLATEKIHGSNARYTYRQRSSFLFSVVGKPQGKMFAGSRNLWKAINSNCAWRRALADNHWIQEWCEGHPGYTLYGEIVPMQKSKDGKINFTYGTPDGKVRFFLFDIRTPDGKWVEITDPLYAETIPDDARVPAIYYGPFDFAKLKELSEGQTKVPGGTHIREGIVVKATPERATHGVGRVQLKIVSNTFLEKDNK